MRPSLDSCSKSGAVSPRRIAMSFSSDSPRREGTVNDKEFAPGMIGRFHPIDISNASPRPAVLLLCTKSTKMRDVTVTSPSTISLGTPLSPTATRVMLLGSGELGKEVVIALQRLGC